MKRFPVAAGNWKMNTTVEEAIALAKELRDRLDRMDGVEKIVCPPFVSLVPVKGIITGSSIKLGAQNMYFQEKGAFTGEVSPTMLAGLCQYVIIGHSERRQYFHEEDSLVNRKLKAALKAGLAPILCVGEKLEDREGGRTEEVITRQISEGLADIPNPGDLVVAYEPIWAIGTGKAATASQANETIGLIRRVVAVQCGGAIAEGVRLLYGGSVTAANILEFISQSEIDGSLVGGASLKAGEFASIAEQIARAK